MMEYVSLSALGKFLIYASLSFAYLSIFTYAYQWFTPYDEVKQICEGKKAPAIALVGAMLGFTMSLLVMSYHGVDLIDFLLWSAIAMVAQLVLFKILYWIIPAQIEADNQAVSILFAGASICVGLIVAASLIP